MQKIEQYLVYRSGLICEVCGTGRQFWRSSCENNYNPCDIVDVHAREHINQQLVRANKVVRVASDVASSSISSVAQSPDKLAFQRRFPAEPQK